MEMDDQLCRICRCSEVDELISIRCQVTSQKRTVGELISAVMGLRYSLTQFDRQHRMPGQLCGECLARLDRAYALWKRCRYASGLARCDAGEEDRYFRCRICATGQAEELVSVTYVCKAWNVQIVAMVYELTNVRWRKGDGLPAFVCTECLKSLNLAYEFKREALGSVKAFEGSTVDGCAWQRMEFRADKPDHLVVDLVSEARLGMRGVVYCSVCNAESSAERLEATCSGCLLEFRNYDEILKNRNPVLEDVDIKDEKDWEHPYESVETENDLKSIEEGPKEFVQIKKEEPLKRTKKLSEKNNFRIESKLEYDCCVPGCVWSGTRSELLWHQKYLHIDLFKDKAEDQLACRFCDKLFPTIVKLNKHCAKKRTIFKCRIHGCTFTAKNVSEIVLHYAEHGPEEKSEKMIPEPLTIPADEAENHIETTYVTEVRCCVQQCNKFGTLNQIQTHFNEVHSNGIESISGTYKCRFCEKSLSDPDNPRAHFQRKVPLYKCTLDGCSLSSKNKKILLKHCTGPHQKVFRLKPLASTYPARGARPDLKSFNAIGSIDECTDILTRKGSWCCTCRKLFTSEQNLRTHRDSNHPTDNCIFNDQPPFQCAQCNAVFSDAAKLAEHVQKTAQERHYYCRGCEHLMWDGRELVKHRYLVHGVEEDGEVGKLYEEEPIGPFRCCGCKMFFFSDAELIEHRHLQHEEGNKEEETVAMSTGQFQCEHCHGVFEKRYELTEHRDKFRNLLYRCKIDGCTFRTEKRLSIKEHVSPHVGHRLVPPPAKLKLFQCCVEGCFFEDATYWTVAHHVYDAHQDVRSANLVRFENPPAFSCLACCMGFGTKSLKDFHVRRRRDQQQMKCDLCERVLGGKIALAAHRIRYHGKAAGKAKERMTCNICGKQIGVYNMAAHLDVHNDVRRWQCAECPAAFNYKGLLQKHARSHTQESPEVCRYGCGKSYRQTTDRNRHERLVHMNEPLPYPCTVCGAAFIRDRDLRIHSRKHTGLKLFPCERCEASFDLLREIETHREVCGGQQQEQTYLVEYVTDD